MLQEDLSVLADPDPVYKGPVHREVSQHGALLPHPLLDAEVSPGDPDVILLIKVIELLEHFIVNEEVAGGGVPPDGEGGAEAEHPHRLRCSDQPAPGVPGG